MKKNGILQWGEKIKDGAEETTPVLGSQAFYAVANGERPGIYPYWKYGFSGVIKAVRYCC